MLLINRRQVLCGIFFGPPHSHYYSHSSSIPLCNRPRLCHHFLLSLTQHHTVQHTFPTCNCWVKFDHFVIVLKNLINSPKIPENGVDVLKFISTKMHHSTGSHLDSIQCVQRFEYSFYRLHKLWITTHTFHKNNKKQQTHYHFNISTAIHPINHIR